MDAVIGDAATKAGASQRNAPWWQRAVIYQVYPRSFQDGNADGVGDLPGLLSRLDYLAELGIDGIWLSPIFPSPMADFGYDVADYVGIDPLFGTLEDFDRLVEGVHARGMKLLLDLVPNHTSDEHPWFREARASRDNPRRDWYIWRDPAADGGPPTNWLSEFGGSAWALDSATGQYYYHAFLDRQPDLNWRNPEVVEAVHEVMRTWMRRGVDGFRVDVIWHLLKDADFRDNPENPAFAEGMNPYARLLPVHTTDLLEVHEVIAGLRAVVDEFPDRLLIGEIYLPVERLVAYYGADLTGVHLPFNFALLDTQWNARALDRLITAYEAALPAGGWPNWVLGNHDRPRIASRVGPDQARVAAMLLLTLRGTPTLYYGDEIGMANVPVPPERIQDPYEKNVPGLGLGRDGVRTPMQWDSGPHAGFSKVDPWLPVAADFTEVNVAAQRGHAHSMLTLHQRLLALRRSREELMLGAYRALAAEGDLLLYARALEGKGQVMVALNLGADPLAATLPGVSGTLLLSTFCDRENEHVSGEITLRANEGVMVAMEAGVMLPR
ncbi:alpha-amylase family glycosyl hydrolase [Xanthobacter sp. DSM 24535]|uniref:alpha-amylase family glycosyl hydrolase n=1 Tax=Roseixanthobacter psychrophilus TaxID=3119917 RepID=UPI00372BC7E0